MADEWATATLGEICEFRAGAVFKPLLQGKKSGAYPFVKVSDMNLPANGLRIEDSNNWVSEDDLRELRAKPLPPGTVIFAKIGEALKQNRLRQVIRETLIDNNMMGAVPHSKSIHPQFFYYALSRFDFAEIAQGTALPYLTVTALSQLALDVPPVAEQRAIAHILGTLDDKIELNRRMNATLEEMARAIFKSWFVDFEPVRAKAEGRWKRGQSLPGLPAHLYDLFPDSLVDSELGEIPKGWEVASLGTLGELTIGGDWGEDIKFDGSIEASCLRGVDLEHLREQGFATAPRRWFKPTSLERRAMDDRDVLIAGSGAGPTGRSLWMCVDLLNVLGPCVYSNFCKRIRCVSTAKAVYLDAWLYEMRLSGEIWEHVNGTSVPNLDANGLLAGKEIPIPSTPVFSAYYNFVAPIWQKLYAGESRTLATIRDALLPKLISGDIRVAKAGA